jgi:GNAT superfamily N-acetyltransferase
MNYSRELACMAVAAPVSRRTGKRDPAHAHGAARGRPRRAGAFARLYRFAALRWTIDNVAWEADFIVARAGPCEITIRPIRAEDKAPIVEAFHALEPRSIYLRFFFQKKELSEEELRRLTEPDSVREAVLVATIRTETGERIVGLGRYTGDGECAQLAFTVEEAYQGRGIAGRLLRRLANVARENGVWRFEAHVLAENGPMLSVLRNSGLSLTEHERDGIVTVTLTLGNAP